MKVEITRQYDELGDKYLKQENVMADVFTNYREELCIEVDGSMYILPKELMRMLR